MNNGVSYTSTKPIEEFEINKKNKPSDLISRLSELRSQYSCFEETERDAYHTLSEAIEALKLASNLHQTCISDASDLISREEVLKYKCDCYDSEGHLLYAVPTGYIVRMPSAQKTGRWKEIYAESDYRNGWIEFTCENCEYQHGLESGQYGWHYGDDIPWKYCPNCGARMEREEE